MNQEEPCAGGGLDPLPNHCGSILALSRDAPVLPCSLRAAIMLGFSSGNNFWGSNQPYVFWVWVGGASGIVDGGGSWCWQLSGGWPQVSSPWLPRSTVPITTMSLCGKPVALQIPVSKGMRAPELGGICYVCFMFFPHHQILV